MTFTSYVGFMRDLEQVGIEYAADKAVALGFSGVEFLDMCCTGAPIDKEKHPAAAVRAALEERGLTVDCYSVYAAVLAYDNERFEREICEIIDYAAAVGAKLFHHTVMPYLKLELDAPKYEEIFPKVLEIERKIVKYCRERGLRCIFEPQGFYFNGVEGLSRLVNTLRGEGFDIGFCADLGNPVYVDSDPGEVIDAMSFCLAHVHVKDYIVSDETTGNRSEARSLGGKYLLELLPGEGQLDLGGYLGKLRATGYDGRIALEYAADDETMKISMEYVKKLWEA